MSSTRDVLATDLHDFLFYDAPDGHHVFRFADARITCGEDEYVRPLATSLAAWLIEKGWVAP